MRTHNLLVSHSWSHSGHYGNPVALLREKSFRSRNYPVHIKDDPIHHTSSDKDLNEAIRAYTAPFGVVLILAGVYASCSRWIDIQIGLAQEGFVYSRPIIAMEPWGSERTSIGVKNADCIVKWRADPVMAAIRDLVK